MNIKEWQKACKEGWAPRKYDNLSREIQRSLKYNSDPKATVRHHLMDTPEQIEYNKAHYEMWGHNLDGTFEYGKYMVFVTQEEHVAIHNQSDETKAKRKETLNTPEVRKKISDASKAAWSNEDYRKARCEKARASWTDERKKRKSESMTGELNPQYGKSGELSPNYGLKRSDETRAKMSSVFKESYIKGNRIKNRQISEEEHSRRSFASSGENNGMYGKHHSEESRKKMSENNTKPMLGKHLSEEAKEKLREAHKRENLSDYIRQELSKTSKRDS